MCSKTDFMHKVKMRAPGTIFFINFYMVHCHWCEQFMGEWNFAIDYAQELHSSEEMEFLKIKAECWDMADLFENEKYPSYTAYCHK